MEAIYMLIFAGLVMAIAIYMRLTNIYNELKIHNELRRIADKAAQSRLE